MTPLIFAALAAVSLPQAAPQAAPAALNVDLPDLPGTLADPTCGGKPALAQQAFCVVTTQAAMQAQADQYNAAFNGQGWQAADGRPNVTYYVRRREGGGCDAFQMLAFADDSRPAAPGAAGYFAFAAIPGDICTTSPAQ